MVQSELDLIIRSQFKMLYRDLHVYRWTFRNLSKLKIFYVVGLCLGLLSSFAGVSDWVIAVWGLLFIGHAWVCGIDHFYIGLRFKKILRSLEKKGIFIGLPKLLSTCEDITPK